MALPKDYTARLVIASIPTATAGERVLSQL